MTNDIQQRGNCPHCGNDQAVMKRGMSNHGYVVKGGWFQGVCTGHNKTPMQTDRTDCDDHCATLRDMAANFDDMATNFETLAIDPDYMHITRREKSHPARSYADLEVTYAIPFCYITEAEQITVRRNTVSSLRAKAAAYRSHADYLQRLADKLVGTPLTTVEKAKGPAPLAAKVKTDNGIVLTLSYTDRGRVYYTGGRGGWIGMQSWRKMEVVS